MQKHNVAFFAIHLLLTNKYNHVVGITLDLIVEIYFPDDINPYEPLLIYDYASNKKIYKKVKEMLWGCISFLGIYDRFEGNQYYRICLSTLLIYMRNMS